MDAKTLFDDKLPAVLKSAPDKAREIGAIFLFKIAGEGGGNWTVDLKSDPPVVKAEETSDAECTIEVSAEDFQAMMKDPQLGMQLYFQGKLKVAGDPMLATKLQNIFSLV